MPGSLTAPRTINAPWCISGVGAICTHRTTLSRRVVRGARWIGSECYD